MADTLADLIGSLPPTQYLILETLAARVRLGEPFWTFPRRLRSALDALQDHSLIRWEHGVTESLEAYLTDKGKQAMLSEGYTVPDVRASALRDAAQWLRLIAGNAPYTEDVTGGMAGFLERRKLQPGAGIAPALNAAAAEIETLKPDGADDGAGREQAYQDLLASIWLYINWRYITRQLTTSQKDLFADAIDAFHTRANAEDPDLDALPVERWWRPDARI